MLLNGFLKQYVTNQFEFIIKERKLFKA